MKSIFEATEVTTPTTFIVLDSKIRDQTMLSEQKEDAKGFQEKMEWVGCIMNVLKDAWDSYIADDFEGVYSSIKRRLKNVVTDNFKFCFWSKF